MSRQIIDERVVEMRFDNKQFEDGVKESLVSLDKLKSKLDLEGSAKSFEVLDKAANNVDLSGIAAGVEALQKRFSTFGIVGMRVIENITDKLMNLTSRAAGFIKESIVGGGLRRAQNIENAHFSLQALLKDEEKVQAVMDDAMKSVDGTAYAYDEAAKAASQFSASGIEAGEKMQSALRGITGVAAMTNAEYESISQIFTTVAGNGRLMGDQLLQLSGRGLNAAATIADYFKEVQGQAGMTEATIRDMVTKGQISFEIFAEAMDWAFGESAFRANETFNGAFANMKSAFARIGADFFSPLIEQNSDVILGINALRERINDVKSALTFNEQKSAISGLAKVTGIETSYLEAMFRVIDKNGSVSLGNLKTLSIHGANGLGTLTKYINGVTNGTIRANDVTKNALNELTGGMEVNRAKVKQFVSEGKINLDIFTHAMENAYGDQKSLSKQFTDSVLDSAKSITEWLQNLDMTKPMSIFYYGVESVKNVFKGLYSVVKPIGKAFGDVFLSFSIDDAMTVAESIEKITEKMRLSEKNSEDLHDAFEGLFSVVKLLIDGFFGLFGIVVPVTKPIGTLGDGILALTGSMGRGLTMFTNWIDKSPLINKAYDKIAEGIQTLMGAAADFMGSFDELGDYIYKLPFVQDIFSATMRGFDFAYEKTRDGLQAFVNEIDGFGDYILENSPDSAVEVFEAFLGILVNLRDTIASIDINPLKAINKLAEKISELITAARENNKGFDEFVTNMERYGDTMSKYVNFEKALDNIESFMDTVSGFVKWFKEVVFPMFDGFSIGGAAATVGGFGMIYAIIKVAKGFEKISGTLKSIPELLGAVKGTLTAYQKELKAETMLKIAEAIAVLAVALTVLSFADTERVYLAAVALGLVGVALVAAVGYLSKSINSGKNSIETALNTFAKSLNQITKAAKWKMIASAIKEIGNVILKITAAILIIAYAYSKDSADMDKAVKLVGIISASILGIIVVMSVLGTKLNKGMRAFGAVAIGVGALAMSLSLIVGAMKNLFKMEIPEDSGTRMLLLAEILLGLMGLTLIVAVASRIGGEGSVKTGPIIALAAALYITVLAVGKLFKMDIPEDYESRFGMLKKIFWGFVGLIAVIAIASRLSKNGIQAGGTIMAMCAFLVTVIGSLFVLSIIPAGKLISGAVALGVVLIALGVALTGAGLIMNKDAYKSVFAMALEIGAIVAALGILSMIPGDKLWTGVLSLSTILVVLAAVFLSVSRISENLAFLSILAMALNVGVIAAALYVLADKPWDSLLAAGGALAAVLLSVAGAFAIISKSDVDATSIASFLLGTVGVIMVGAAIAIVAKQPWEAIAAAGGALSAVLLAMGGAFGIISTTKVDLKSFAAFLGGILGVAVVGYVLYQLAEQPWQNLLAAAASISLVLIAIAGALAIVSFVGGVAPAALAGIGILDLFIADLVIVLAALGYVQEKAGDLINKGGDTLIKIGEYIGGFIGSIIEGIGQGVANALADIGSGLSEFTDNASGFFDTMGNLKPEVLTGVRLLADAVLALTAASFLDGIMSLIGFGGFAGFGDTLEDLGKAVKRFGDQVKGIDPESVMAASYCAKMIAGVYNNLPKEGGWLQKITGESKNLAQFAEELLPFGIALVGYSNAVKGKINQEAVESSINAATIISDFANTLPREGGIWQKIIGEQKSLNQFAVELLPFGVSLVAYSAVVKGNIDQEAVEASIKAAEVLKAFNDTLPDMGGLAGAIFGQQKTLAEFGWEMVAFGRAMVIYSNTISGNVDNEAITASANAAQVLADVANSLGGNSGLLSVFSRDTNLSDFGKQLKKFGGGLADYSEAIADVDVVQMAVVTNQVQRLIAIAEATNGLDSSGMTGFSEALKTMGENGIDGFISTFTDSVSRVETAVQGLFKITTSVITKNSKTLTTSAKTAGKNVPEGLDSGIRTSQNKAISTIQKLAILLVKTLRADLPSITFVNIGGDTIIALASGIRNREWEAIDAIRSIAVAIIQTLNSNLLMSDFEEAGKNAAKGFIKGVKSQEANAKNVGRDIGNATKDGTKKALDEHSPSKEMAKIAAFAGIGFINELMLYVAKAAKAGEEVGNASTKGIRKVITDADEYFKEMSNPVLRPTVDLSNVNDSFSKMQKMFNSALDTTLQFAGNADVSFRASKTNNDDLVNAINELKDQLDTPSVTNQYTIDGINYQEGDNVSEAIEALIRATRIRKRV